MSRERFEELFAVPEWATYHAGEYGYEPTDNPFTNSKRSAAVQLINFRLQGYQSRQPEIDELVEALEALRSVCFDRRDALNEFERLGDLYYREFGRLRPGKDDPMRDSSEPENQRQFEEWSRARAEAAIDKADEAIAKHKGEA